MYFSGAKAEAFIRKPDLTIAAALIFGPDRGLVRERMAALARAVAGDVTDPFRVVEIPASALKADPARLHDEAASLAFGGGRRLLIVRDAGDVAAALFADFLARAPKDGAFVLVEGGDLSKRSTLRAAFESSSRAASVACYGDDERSVRAFIAELLRQHKLTAEADALDVLCARLGQDRDQTRGEIAKLALFMDGGPDERGNRRVDADAVMAVVGDGGAASLDAVVLAAADGDYAELDRALSRALLDGESPIRILNAAQRHVERLHLARAHMDAGASAEQAMMKLKPPVFFRSADRFRRQLSAWEPARLAAALHALLEADIACKSTAAPDEALAHRALARVAAAARSGRGRPQNQ